jgi:hypothetical protein
LSIYSRNPNVARPMPAITETYWRPFT